MSDQATPIRRALADSRIQEIMGARLRAWREGAGLSLEQLGARAGLSPLTLHKAEHGGNFTMRTLIRILRALGRVEQLDAFLPPVATSPLDLVSKEPDGR